MGIFLCHTFVYFFITLPKDQFCLFIFFYKFNCTDRGLELGDPAPLTGQGGGGGGGIGYFWGGYVPRGTPNWHPVLKRISPKIDTPF